MAYTLDTRTVDTDAGTYTVAYELDQDTESPRDNVDCTLTLIATHTYYGYDNSELESKTYDAATALLRFMHTWRDTDKIERAFHLWKTATGSSWNLETETRGGNDWTEYFQLWDSATSPDVCPNPAQNARVELNYFANWREGDTFGYVVTGPDGGEIESVWGYIGFHGDGDRGHVDTEIDAAIAHDVTERTNNANVAGSGFVGLI